MSDLKTITVWGHASGPNPWKALIILEELGLPYEHKIVDFPDMKKEPYISLNPNGRVPTIEDPNTGITLWEVSVEPFTAGVCHEMWIHACMKDGEAAQAVS
jgi:hypothetical protein